MASFHPYRLRLARPYRWAMGVQHVREGGLVHDGGWGEVALPPHEPFDAAWAARAVHDAERDLGSAHPRIRCAVTTARWSDGESMSMRLAAASGRHVRRDVTVNALLTGETPAEVADEAHRAWQAGFRTLKLKVAGVDMERVAAARDAAPQAALRLDANTALQDPLQAFDAWAAFDIEYVEQPVPPADAALLRRLADGAIPIAIDEAATDAAEIGRRLADGQATVVILKPQRLGGPQGTLDAMTVAEDHGAKVIVTNSLESSVGVHAALHIAALLRDDVACGLATSAFLAEDVAPAPRIDAGRMRVPTGPGLGIEPEVPA